MTQAAPSPDPRVRDYRHSRVVSGRREPRIDTARGPQDLAPISHRLGAMLLDLLFAGTLGFVIWLVYFADYPWHNRPLEIASGAFWFSVLWLFNYVGWTPGMRANEVQIVTGEGEAPGVWRAFVRSAGALLSLAPLGLGYLWAVFDPHRRTWHDILAGTYVVLDYRHETNEAPIPDIEELRDRRLGFYRLRDH